LKVIIFAAIDYDEAWQIPQQLANSFCLDGHNVLFVDNTGTRTPSLRRDIRRVFKKALTILRATRGFVSSKGLLTRFAPFVLPFPEVRPVAKLNFILIKHRIASWVDATDPKAPLVLISFIPTQLVLSAIRSLHPSLSIYYCADDMLKSMGKNSPLSQVENEICNLADIICATSDLLLTKMSVFGKTPLKLPAGLDPNLTYSTVLRSDRSYLSKIPEGSIGYIGGICSLDDKFDLNFLTQVVKTLPNEFFVLVGRAYGPVSSLSELSNVLLLDQVTHDAVPAILKLFSVGIIPYKVNPYTDHVHPCKIYEYLGAGLPVVSTNLREVISISQQSGGLISIASTPQHFAELIQDSKKLSLNLAEKRRQYASANSWHNRYSILSSAITSQLHLKIFGKSFHAADLYPNIVTVHRRVLIRWTSLISLAVLFVFTLPLFINLVIPNRLRSSAELVVVVLGDGYDNYLDRSIYPRLRDIRRIRDDNPSALILISHSIKGNPSDIELIQPLLLSEKVPANPYLFKLYRTSSTRAHMCSLAQDNVFNDPKTIELVSSPFHSRRAALELQHCLGKKAVHVYPIRPIDSHIYRPLELPSLSHVKLFLKELSALLIMNITRLIAN